MVAGARELYTAVRHCLVFLPATEDRTTPLPGRTVFSLRQRIVDSEAEEPVTQITETTPVRRLPR